MSRIHRLFWLLISDRLRLLVALGAGEGITLSFLHHGWNLWGLPLDKQLLAVFLLGPVLGMGICALIIPVWKEIRRIRRQRWLLFAATGVLIASGLTWALFRNPELEHDLVITPSLRAPGGAIQIREVRLSHGRVVPLSTLAQLRGWDLSTGILSAHTSSAERIRLSFHGPIGEMVRISFITAPSAGAVDVQLDGQTLRVDLRGERGNETRARLLTRYGWGVLEPLVLPILALVDILGILAVLASLWIAHEMGQGHRHRQNLSDRLRKGDHFVPLLLVLGIAFGLHVINILAVPLRVSADGPSYVQGAAHWVAFRNFDGASSYRGPALSFLLAPAMTLFERSALAAKLVLHSVAFACVPIAYRIGWQLSASRRVATAGALITAVSPDLNAFSSLVLSEVPHVFALFLFVSSLISALRTRSPAWMVAALVAGSVAVLARPDNIVVFLIGVAAITWVVLGAHSSSRNDGRRITTRKGLVRDVAIAVALAVLPLLAWSAHNNRVHGFFGISNYAGEILYDGWIYFAESDGRNLLDARSQAVRRIDQVVPIVDRDGAGPPTGWTVYHRMLESGYDSNRAFAELGQAAIDSIRAHGSIAWQVLLKKLRQAPRPQATTPGTILKPWAEDASAARTAAYFDLETGLHREFASLQQGIYQVLDRLYAPTYSVLFAWCLTALWLGMYGQPARVRLPLGLIFLTVLLLPNVVGLASWRYVFPAIILMGPVSCAVTGTVLRGSMVWIRSISGPAAALA